MAKIGKGLVRDALKAFIKKELAAAKQEGLQQLADLLKGVVDDDKKLDKIGGRVIDEVVPDVYKPMLLLAAEGVENDEPRRRRFNGTLVKFLLAHSSEIVTVIKLFA